jgi:Bacteriophage baseplate protein W
MTDLLGSGLAFPLQVDRAGGIALARGHDDIHQALELILGTAPGERPMRPEFGSRISEYVFAPANAATAGQLAYEVRIALERWEPRIDVQEVDVSFDDAEVGVLYLDVSYLIRGTNDPRNLVFPFYVIPEHEPAAVRGGPAALALEAGRP